MSLRPVWSTKGIPEQLRAVTLRNPVSKSQKHERKKKKGRRERRREEGRERRKEGRGRGRENEQSPNITR